MDIQNQKRHAPTNSVNAEVQGCLYAKTPPGITVGVLTSSSEASPLALLAAGIAGLAERRARRGQKQ